MMEQTLGMRSFGKEILLLISWILEIDDSPKTSMAMANPPFFIGDASSNGCYLAIVMLVFRGVQSMIPMRLLRWED